MKTKIPKKVNVLGHQWTVEFVKPTVFEDKRRGEVEFPKRIIRISNEESKDMHWNIFLHELRHAWQFESGFDQVLDRTGEEIDAESFASFITSLQKQGIL